MAGIVSRSVGLMPDMPVGWFNTGIPLCNWYWYPPTRSFCKSNIKIKHKQP